MNHQVIPQRGLFPHPKEEPVDCTGSLKCVIKSHFRKETTRHDQAEAECEAAVAVVLSSKKTSHTSN